jgi:exopolyphosphatase/guanosine-5'-triphosphate,3'-diphosphate pyrophosphatase
VRIGVLDVGSNTVHLLVVDAHPGSPPLPAFSLKHELRLAEHLSEDGALNRKAIESLIDLVARAREEADELGCAEFLAFATSAVRDATNGDAVLESVRASTGVQLTVLNGADEARLTFLAVRRWFGWSAGRLIVFDIGGGSLEIASGTEEVPDVAVSLPLGAGRVTRDFNVGAPMAADDLKSVRRQVRAQVADVLGPLLRSGSPELTVGTSKTFRTLARMAGAAPSAEGVYVRRSLRRTDVNEWVPKLASMTVEERATLPGVDADRAHQILAGAVVAEAALDLVGSDEIEVCPWALREGVILRRIDGLTD